MRKSKLWCNGSLCFIIFLLFGTSSIFSQNNKSDFWQHVRFGGGIGLSFGDGFFSGTLAPSAIYEFNDQFAAGVALNGTYASLKNNNNATILGGSILALYNVIPEIQLSAEFEELNVNRTYKYLGSPDVTTNYWYPALFLGAGFRSNNFTIGVRYDVLFDADESIYASAFAPFVRVYF
ncbi:alpha-ketoglutarate decarboxylase [Aequorivita flava]|uniref:Alpha-ketoglutarate decarboxylase n=1 Tax=Aequorivita flava TaxID=3114371 RepID=A0AB35YNW8_9FLAO